jgi:hypothetical protein
VIACNSKGKVTAVSSDETDSLHEHSTSALEKLSLGEWFTARCELLCDEEHGKYLDFKKLEKYGQHTPYDFTQVNKLDSTIISFDVIADCCIDFVGGAQIRNDTLILEYRPPHDSLLYGCDCSCDYRMIYRIDKKDRKWTTLKTDYKVGF